MTVLAGAAPLPRRALTDIFAAPHDDPARGFADATKTGDPVDIALPPLRMGAHLLPLLAPHPLPADVRWDEPSFRSMIPWVCTFHDAGVHGDGGIVTGAGCVVSDTLVHVAPIRQGFAELDSRIVLLGTAAPTPLAGTWLSLLCGSHWNHYHWLIDGIGRLAAADKATLERCDGVLLPANLSPTAAHTVHLSGVTRGRQVLEVQPNDSVNVPRLVVPWRISDGFWPHPALRSFLAGLLPETARNPAFPPRIYIDRRGAHNRRLTNEDDVIDALASAGVVPIRLEALSFTAQVALFRQAELVVGPHGAGLANLAFAPPSCAAVALALERRAARR